MAAARDSRIDQYIESAEPFARPILTHLRDLVHQACPDVTETIKWRMPFFDYKGALCSMASFKAHASFGLWKGQLIPEVVDHFGDKASDAMGTFGRITSLADLPADAKIVGWIREATDLNVRGEKLPQRTKAGHKGEVDTPDDLLAALEGNESARLTYEGFPPSKRREYVEWLTDAKTDATRQRRLAQAIEWMAEGKSRMWKYERK